METYSYDELPTDAFRYLVLLPGAIDDPLKCSLHTSRVHQVAYDAVSYVWGTDQRDCDIICDGRLLRITPNLHSVLRRVRLLDAPRNIWADSICINQDNLQEKGRQVTIMGQIYRNAEKVLIYIGTTGEEHAPRVLTLLNDIRDMIDAGLVQISNELQRYDLSPEELEFSTWDQFPHSDPTAPVLHDARWASINALINQEWFHRGWVVREAGLARQAIVIWGRTEFPWHELMRTLVWRHRRAVKSISIPAEDRFRSHLEAYEAQHQDTIRVFYQHGSWQACSLLDYLHFARVLLLKDPRDRIYAFLDLAENSIRELHVVPNYEDPPLKVYRDFAVDYVRKTGDISILKYVKHDEESIQTHVMTWAPDWSKEEEDLTGFISAGDNYPPLLPRTGQAAKPRLLDGNVLQVHAVVFDSVLFASDLSSSVTITSVALFNLWRAVRKSITESPYRSINMLEPFFDTLTVQGYIGELNLWYRERKAYIDAFERLRAEAQLHDKAAWNEDEVANLESSTIHGFIASATSGKRVVVTKRGYIGTAPAVTQEGDQCAIIFGSSSPCFLRETARPDEYAYLGPGIIPGKSTTDLYEYGLGFYDCLGVENSKDWLQWDVKEQDISLV